MKKAKIIINCAEIADHNWTFLKDDLQHLNLQWFFFSSSDKYWIEKRIKAIKLGRYRATFLAALKAKYYSADVLISHLPRTTLWLSLFAKLLGVKAKHIAFSFNFTTLPTGWAKRLMRFSFRYVDEFVVYSNVEKSLYAEYFAIPDHKITMLPWAMNVPAIEPVTFTLPERYVCAVGGEGRDYQCLFSALAGLSNIACVVVTRPDAIRGLQVPKNVFVQHNLSSGAFWYVVKNSDFTVVPLRDAQTNCGHITVVGSLLLNKPIVSTFSTGTTDYLNSGNSLLTPPGDVTALRESVNRLWGDQAFYRELTQSVKLNARTKFGLAVWVNYFERYIIKLDECDVQK